MKRLLVILVLLGGLILFAQSNPKIFKLKNSFVINDSLVTYFEATAVYDSLMVKGHLGFYRTFQDSLGNTDSIFIRHYENTTAYKNELLNYADSLVTQ